MSHLLLLQRLRRLKASSNLLIVFSPRFQHLLLRNSNFASFSVMSDAAAVVPLPCSTLEERIKSQGNLVRRLKAEKVEDELIRKEVALLLDLKNQCKLDSSKDKEGSGKFQLKTAKGTRDYSDAQMRIRKRVLNTVSAVFERHGAVCIDTPVFELKEILTGKYGEDSKLIYDLKDQGGEMLSLRYDLTVPFARFLAQNKIQTYKRFHIGKVYRRDQPVMTKGRYREFYQCDFDIAGDFGGVMIADAEIVRIVYECLSDLKLGAFRIKVNHRQFLDGMLAVCGVPGKSIRGACSSIDKLDKISWEEVRTELLNERGLSPECADKIGTYTRLSGHGPELVTRLEEDSALKANKSCQKAFADLKLLFSYLEAMGVQHVEFDLSLARGLDYYTGLIYEAVLLDTTGSPQAEEVSAEAGASQLPAVGSVAGGGRYDKLVGGFGNMSIPCIGVSIGVERIFATLEAKLLHDSAPSETQVFVCTPQKGMVVERLRLVTELWNDEIKAEMAYKSNAKALDQFQFAEKNRIPLIAIIGKGEVEQGLVKLRHTNARIEEDLPREKLMPRIRQLLQDETFLNTPPPAYVQERASAKAATD